MSTSSFGRCPGAGKWVENDEASRESYERRTAARHSQLQGLGWNASAKLSFSFSQSSGPQVCCVIRGRMSMGFTHTQTFGCRIWFVCMSDRCLRSASQFHQDASDVHEHKLQMFSGSQQKSSKRHKDVRHSLKRLPQDIRHQLEQLQARISGSSIVNVLLRAGCT